MADKKSIASLLQDEQQDGWFDRNIIANSPAIIGVFANFVVIFADYRVYDVIYRMTGIWWRALSASLACAVPFMLWELAWQYNHTTEGWRKASLLMAGLAFVTSIVLGVADYVGFDVAYADVLLGGVVIMTGVHTVVGFLYYYNDPDVARKRAKSNAIARAEDQRTNAELAKQLLEDGKSILQSIEELNGKYNPEDVEAVLAILNGKKVRKQEGQKQHGKPQSQQPQRQFADDTKENPTTPPSNHNGQH